MRLLLDLGNSRLKWALYHDGESVRSGASSYDENETGVLIDRLNTLDLKPDVCGLVSTGRDGVVTALKRWVDERWSLQLHQAYTQKKDLDITNSYENPDNMGTDRWLAMVAAKQISQQRCAVLDAGTAITLDLLDESGVHIGGWIVPGIEMMKNMLSLATARIGLSNKRYSQSLGLGQSTSSCIETGLEAVLQGFISQTQAVLIKHGINAVFLTGGDAPVFSTSITRTPLLKFNNEPELVLKGLNHWLSQHTC